MGNWHGGIFPTVVLWISTWSSRQCLWNSEGKTKKKVLRENDFQHWTLHLIPLTIKSGDRLQTHFLERRICTLKSFSSMNLFLKAAGGCRPWKWGDQRRKTETRGLGNRNCSPGGGWRDSCGQWWRGLGVAPQRGDQPDEQAGSLSERLLRKREVGIIDRTPARKLTEPRNVLREHLDSWKIFKYWKNGKDIKHTHEKQTEKNK